MSGRKDIGILFLFVLSVSLIASSVAAVLAINYSSRVHFQMVGDISGDIIKELPDAENIIFEVLKDYKHNSELSTGMRGEMSAGLREKTSIGMKRNISTEPGGNITSEAAEKGANILLSYGYHPSDFWLSGHKVSTLLAAAGFLFGSLLFLFTFFRRNRREIMRIEALTEYLERVNTGGSNLILQMRDDVFSKLQDEIYKTVTFAYQTRDSALEARRNFADNLSNIAHQLKTPITAISLSAQMLKGTSAKEYADQIDKQIKRLTHLEEALLLLSRLDAGTLLLESKAVDVFTVLTLAADNLQEVFSESGVSMEIQEAGEVQIAADLEWTMEAVMNLMKNCMEHTPSGGTVRCSYDQNPLYSQILIWDDGEGFQKNDLPHLFERFYRGQNAKEGGIGIGLSLAKAIIESQNGTVSAKNLPAGGACFEIRFYCH